MADGRVILRYRDGRTALVALDRTDPSREVVVARHDDGEPCEVPFLDLKAVFFPRTTPDESLEPASGSRITIEFNDGEVIRGAAHYNPERNGFFLFPDDRSKN